MRLPDDPGNVNSNASLSRRDDASREISHDEAHRGNLEPATDNASDARSGENNSSSLTIAGKSETAIGRRDDSKSSATSQRRSRSALRSDFVADSDHRDADVRVVFDDCVADDRTNTRVRRRLVAGKTRSDTNELSTNVATRDEASRGSAQDPILGEVGGEGKERKRSREKKTRRGEPRDGLKRKTAPANDLSRKIRSFLRRKSRLAITDSDCTLILPGPRCIRGKRYEKIRGRLKASQSLPRRNGTSGASYAPRIGCVAPKPSPSRPSTDARDPLEGPPSIPLETQELLNKNYLEYYRSLKRNVAPARPGSADKKDKRPKESRDCLSESRTLRKCSVLSCMINNTL